MDTIETQAERWARETRANEITAEHRARGVADGAAGRPVDAGVDQLHREHRAVYLAGYSDGTRTRIELTRSEGWRDYTWTEGGSLAYWTVRLAARNGTTPETLEDGRVYIPGARGQYSDGPSFTIREVR